MGFLQRVSTVRSVPRVRAMTTGDYNTAFWSGDNMGDAWLASLSAAGVRVTPDLAMTLSAMYCGVSTIAYDVATLPVETFQYRADGGKDKIRARSADWMKGGIADLAYMLRWQPNDYQTSTEYFVSQVAQFLLRGRAYAEIVPGPNGFLAQLLPRHPDRVFPERLPNGRLRYKLIEATGQPRYVTQDEMHVVRDLSSDPVSHLSRLTYGASAMGTALAAERAAGKFFKSGMTAAVVATYTGGTMEDEDERALHASITRYAAGVENTFGLLLIPDDIKVSNLALSPEQAQMMAAREWTVYEVARYLKISPRKLMANSKSSSYASAYQDAIDHVVGCIRPLARTFEQAIQRDLILERDTYFVKFNLRELLQGDPAQLADFISKTIASRAMTPSEARMLFLDLNPDAHLDQLSESDNQPGKPGAPAARATSSRTILKGMLALHDNAIRCVRRERVAVEKLAKKHASDVEGWQTALREFEADQAAFVATVMRMPLPIARGYCAQHGSVFEAKGMVMLEGDAGTSWEQIEADELAALALQETEAAA